MVTPQGEVSITLPLPGRHNVMNALAAASLAIACGVSLATIAEGLASAQPVPGRQIAHALAGGVVLVDDSYNANPASLDAAISTLSAAGGEAWLVLGDMRELGAEGEALHAEAGRHACAAGIQRLYTLGPLSAEAARSFGEGAWSFESHAALIDALRIDLAEPHPHGLRVLVKGSRGSAMDRIVSALLPNRETTPHAA